jgi:hypothetical protein
MSDADETHRALMREFERVFGDDPQPSKGFVLLPLVDAEDALAFYRTVPDATPFDHLLPLALAYRAAHPVSIGTLHSIDPEAERSG